MQTPFPAYQGNDAYVFVCYSHADTKAVYEDIGQLSARGLRIW